MEKGKPYPSLKDNRNFQRQVEGYTVVQESMSTLIKGPLEFPSRKKKTDQERSIVLGQKSGIIPDSVPLICLK